MDCQHCANLQPPELLNIVGNVRVSKLIKIEDLHTSRCSECQIIWKALKLSTSSFNDEDFVEVLIARNLPLKIRYTPHQAQSVRIELFTRQKNGLERDINHDGPYIGTVREVAEYSGSDECLDLAASWLKNCKECHPHCQLEENSPLPTRVIDVGHHETQEPRLLETEGLTSEPYVALSYCWGFWEQHPPMKTVNRDQAMYGLKANYEAHKRAIKYSDMPSTIQDAVTICRRLGIRFLWVDALCIIQHDKEEWERECGKMCQVYSCATLTISATHSDGSARGIFAQQQYGSRTKYVGGLRDGRKVYVRPNIAINHDDRDPGLLSRTQAFKDFTTSSSKTAREPLTLRAWCMQESVLSNRLLHYTVDELVWECNTSHHCECGSSSGPVDLDENCNVLLRRPDMIATSSYTAAFLWRYMWSQWVHIFTRRDISYLDDKLPALSGLAVKFSDLLNHCLGYHPRYVAGLWDGEMLPRGLCWHVAIEGHLWSSMENDFNSEYRPQRACPWRAPTWSFMSVDGPIQPHTTFGFESAVLIEDAITKPRNREADPFGNIQSGYIVLRGRIIEDLEVGIEGSDFHLGSGDDQLDKITFFVSDKEGNKVEFLADVPQDVIHNPRLGYCLLFVGYSVIGLSQREPNFLVLRPATDDNKKTAAWTNCYERVGLANIRALPSFGVVTTLNSDWAEDSNRGEWLDITLV